MDYFSFNDRVIEIYRRCRRPLLGAGMSLDEAENLMNSLAEREPDHIRVYYELFFRYFAYTLVRRGGKYVFAIRSRKAPLDRVNLGFLVKNEIYMYGSMPGDDEPVMTMPESLKEKLCMTSSVTSVGAVVNIDDYVWN
jgi:hypothetical protein